MPAKAKKALEELALYFTSGNSVPVDRAVIKGTDFWKIATPGLEETSSDDIGAYTIAELMKLATRLGISTESGVEGYVANLEDNLLRIIRSTHGFLDKIEGNAARTGSAPEGNASGSKLAIYEL